NRLARMNAAGTASSSRRTNGASNDATIAPAIHQRVPRSNAPAIRKKHSAAHGYPIVSGAISDENIIEGTSTAPAAANSAARRPATKRARPYVGKTVATIATTFMYLTAEYACRTSWMTHAGAMKYV